MQLETVGLLLAALKHSLEVMLFPHRDGQMTYHKTGHAGSGGVKELHKTSAAQVVDTHVL